MGFRPIWENISKFPCKLNFMLLSFSLPFYNIETVHAQLILYVETWNKTTIYTLIDCDATLIVESNKLDS